MGRRRVAKRPDSERESPASGPRPTLIGPPWAVHPEPHRVLEDTARLSGPAGNRSSHRRAARPMVGVPVHPGRHQHLVGLEAVDLCRDQRSELVDPSGETVIWVPQENQLVRIEPELLTGARDLGRSDSAELVWRKDARPVRARAIGHDEHPHGRARRPLPGDGGSAADRLVIWMGCHDQRSRSLGTFGHVATLGQHTGAPTSAARLFEPSNRRSCVVLDGAHRRIQP